MKKIIVLSLLITFGINLFGITYAAENKPTSKNCYQEISIPLFKINKGIKGNLDPHMSIESYYLTNPKNFYNSKINMDFYGSIFLTPLKKNVSTLAFIQTTDGNYYIAKIIEDSLDDYNTNLNLLKDDGETKKQDIFAIDIYVKKKKETPAKLVFNSPVASFYNTKEKRFAISKSDATTLLVSPKLVDAEGSLFVYLKDGSCFVFRLKEIENLFFVKAYDIYNIKGNTHYRKGEGYFD